MSMMRPIPFWPSFEPWKKLTPVQVRIRRRRRRALGRRVELGERQNHFREEKQQGGEDDPTTGEKARERNTPVAWLQSTPLVPLGPPMSWFIRPTPMIEPISACELEFGMPKYQVPTFQMMAAISSANTIAKPAADPTCRMSSTGSSDTIVKATNPVEVITPSKFQMPDHTTATCAGIECV